MKKTKDSLDFLGNLSQQLRNKNYRELTGIKDATEVYSEFKAIKKGMRKDRTPDDLGYYMGTAKPKSSPRLTPLEKLSPAYD